MKAVAAEGVVGISPYTPQNVDLVIAHLERVLRSVDSDSLFAQSYWRSRILQAYATVGLVQQQKDRLARLLDRFSPIPAGIKSREHTALAHTKERQWV
jgi:hypothetical protein